ncbi:MAG: HDIG domain-containing protein [Lewinellaceae bacterium]|nr:HDIG domain-containing protein [Phaeodactylibacter sp.]MCB9349250.1 HDIG domain-containing protein [Lewinellaceae bacterium]
MSAWRTTIEGLPTLVKYLMVAGVVAFITFLFPNNAKFKYEFDKGQSWRYEDLRAPFDFAIRKPQEEVQAEKKKLQESFTPYYELDQEVITEKKRSLAGEFDHQLELVREEGQFEDVVRQPQKYLQFGKHFLESLFQKGILKLAPEHEGKGEDFVINVVRGNTTQAQTVGNLLFVEEAKGLLSDSLPRSKLAEPEFLYPILEGLISPNLTYNDTLSRKILEEELSEVPTFRGRVPKGQLIVTKGAYITDDIYQKLISFQAQYEEEVTQKQSYLGVFIGYLLLSSLIIGVFLLYVRLYAKPVFYSFNKLIFILLLLVVYSYFVYAVEQVEALSTYMIPFCILPIVIKNFYDERLALFTHLVVVLLASFLSSLGYEFAFLQILAGIVVLLSDVETREWSRFFYSIFFIFLIYATGYLGLSLIVEGNIMEVDWTEVTWLALSAFLTLLAYPLIPLLERFFGFTSSITLVELSDMNRPLLRELSLKAPGTMQHSLQVANLADEAARKIGANPLLVRVGALYHDVGKTLKPEYFIENQSGKNPHDELSDLESAKVIISHVTEGVKMAKKARLPAILIDFIKTHHGTTRAEYFYRNYIKDNPELEVDENDFRYPGPKPRSKEETLLMMADSIEAACKSLKSPSEEDLNNLIDKIIAGKTTQGQLEHSNMTFEELEVCKKSFKQMMKSVHHVRIEYPEEKAKKETQEG